MRVCITALLATVLAGCGDESAQAPGEVATEGGTTTEPDTSATPAGVEARQSPSSAESGTPPTPSEEGDEAPAPPPFEAGQRNLVAVPGTSVQLPPPEGFVPADRFAGFMREATGSSIMVSEIPGPYAEVAAGFRDENVLRAQGMTLVEHSTVEVDGQPALLVHVEQTAYGTLFGKWMLAVDRSGSTALLVASFPEELAEQGEALRASLLAAGFGAPGDPADALAFVVTPAAPFQVARVFGQNMILSPDGRFPVEDESVPLMVLALSASEGLAIADQKGFAERRVMQTAQIEELTIERTDAITIGPQSGYATIATGVGESAATPLTLYQVVLFDAAGYCLIQGLTPTASAETVLPTFERIARSFEMRAQVGVSSESDRE